MNRFATIDEEGYFLSGGARINDDQYGFELLQHLEIEHRTLITHYQGQKVIIEAFDAPLIVQSLTAQKSLKWLMHMPYRFTAECDLTTLTVDEWDRFQGKTDKGISFVLSRAAQMQLFNLVDEFDDDSITVSGQKIEILPLNSVDRRLLKERDDVNQSSYWSSIYKNWDEENNAPGWESGGPTPTLKEIIPQIKLPKSRICVLGCGTGHDAAYLASLGHIVTAVDFSAEAIEKARSAHKEAENLKFVVADAFRWAKESQNKFDIIYEHTFYCAIDPDRRTELADYWRKLLAPGGYLLGIFFVFQRMGGPPFGASEWEIRERLKKDFDFLYWTRWKTTPTRHLGIELVLYAQKR